MSITTARPVSRWATAVAGAKVIGGIYRDRALTAYAARVQKDPAARLGLAEYQADPYPIYDQIRTQGPLAPTRLGNLISATHAVCSEIVRSRFVVFRPEQAADDPLPREMLDLSLLEMDPPEHTRLRRLVAPAFTPRRMAKYEILVAQRIGELLDAVDPHAGFDLVSEFAAPLPIAVISALLGVPDVDEKAFAAYGATLATALDGISSVGHLRRLLHAQSQLRQIFADLFERRTSDPRNDIVSALLAEQNEEVTPALLGPLCRLLLVAGFETTVNAIGNGVRALLANPDQWQMLVEDPDRAPAAVEEVLRYDPPVQVTARAAPDATEVAGVPVARGQATVLLLTGANGDPAAYASPNSFDITRRPGVDHLAFSGGIHYCLGAPLARLELAAAFRATGPASIHSATRRSREDAALDRYPRASKRAGGGMRLSGRLVPTSYRGQFRKRTGQRRTTSVGSGTRAGIGKRAPSDRLDGATACGEQPRYMNTDAWRADHRVRSLDERTGRRRRYSAARFSPREPSRCVARVDDRHVGDRVVWSGKHRFAPQDGSGECPQLTGIGRRFPWHVFDRAAGV